MNAAVMEDYLKFIANRRLRQIGLPEQDQPVPVDVGDHGSQEGEEFL